MRAGQYCARFETCLREERFVSLDLQFSNRIRMIAACLALGAGLTGGGGLAMADNPFSQLAGTWSGSGTAKFEGGKTESLRCKGYYTNTGSDNLGLSIRCANASAKVELRANLVYSNGNISGNWEERTYNQAGTVSGKATSKRLNLAISGGISGNMAVAIGGKTHSVNVSTGGPTLQGINISMSR